MEELNDILGKHFSGETNAAEEQRISQWKNEHEAEYAMLAKAWNETIDFEFKAYDDTKAWDKIAGQLNEPETKVFKLGRVMKYAIAASFAVLVGLTLTWYLSVPEFILVNNETAEVKALKLPDGTQIWLASGTTLEYASDFKNQRDIKLNGVAFFEVAKDPNHPFIIATKSGEIEVLGTGFNVEATADHTEVSVAHGLVALRNEVNEIKLGAGQMAVATNEGVSLIPKADPNETAWMNGEFVFDHTPLVDVVKQLNTYYTKEIVLGSEKAKGKELTAKFNNQSLEEIIEIIVLTCDLESEFSKDRVVLK